MVLFENIDYSKLHWQSDWNGDDVGYDSINVVGYYTYYNLNLYINIEENEVIEMWFDEEE